MKRAVIFDFDGLILETEQPTYQSWQEVYRAYGQELTLTAWSAMIGTLKSEFDPRGELEKLVGRTLDWEKLEGQRQASENVLIEAQPVLPGVEAYLRDARRLGLKIGLASNSPIEWVEKHLTRIGLFDRFDCIRTSTEVQRYKPDPAVYLSALEGLGVQAGEAFALEDSPLGIRSAKSAGLYCVAVPNILTSQLDLSQADMRLDALTEMPLEQLLYKIKAG